MLGHLIGDFVFVPLFWPWIDYNWPVENRNIAGGVVQTLTDLSMLRPLSPSAIVVWQFERIGMELIMMCGVIFVAFRKIPDNWAKYIPLGLRNMCSLFSVISLTKINIKN